jgi:hypothetical protein
MKGIDFTTPLTLAKAKELKAAGYDFICRYLVPEAYKSKRITKAEAEAATQTGLKILSVFEIYADFRQTKGGTRSTEVAGREDGKAALKEARLVGMPVGSTIYFAVDFDTKDYDMVEAYLRNAFVEIPGYACGVYGSYYVVEEMARRKACTHFWQTYAWSNKKISKYNNVYQYKNGVNVIGIAADLNEASGNEGFWNIETAPQIIKLLKKGMKGEEVKVLQTLLNKNGYQLIVDGDFGFMTETAVKSYQKEKGIVVDGIVGTKTWAMLYGE